MSDFKMIIENYFSSKDKEITSIQKYFIYFPPINEIYLVVADEKGYIVSDNCGEVKVHAKTPREDTYTLELFDYIFTLADTDLRDCERYED